MTTVTTALSQEGIEGEAAAIGVEWENVTGLAVRTFEDGTSFITVHAGEHGDAQKIVAHLVMRGLAERA
jgi:hypothetical protein